MSQPAEEAHFHQTTCYLLLGGSDGMLTVSARLRGKQIEAATIESEGGFGGPVWAALASSLTGISAERDTLTGRIERFRRAGIIPEELDLEPLVLALLKFAA